MDMHGASKKALSPLQFTPSERVIIESCGPDAAAAAIDSHRMSTKISSATSATLHLPDVREQVGSFALHPAMPTITSNRILPVETIPVVSNPLVTDTTDAAAASPLLDASDGRLRRLLSYVFLQHRHENIEIYHATAATESFHWMIHPNSNFRKIWDVYIALLVIYVCIMTPLYMGFTFLDWSAFVVAEEVFDVCFALDMILSFRTGIYAFGEVRMDPMFVAHHYFKSWFIVDLTSNIPFQLFFTDGTGVSQQKSTVKFVKLQKLPKLLRFGILLKYMRQYAKYYKLLLTSSFMMLSMHCFAYVACRRRVVVTYRRRGRCAWAFVFNECDLVFCPSDSAFTIYSQSYYNVLLLYLGIAEASQFQATVYLASPIVKMKNSMYLLSIGVVVVGVVACALMFGNMLTLLLSWDQQNSTFRNRMDVISSEMKYYELPPDLQHRVKRNYDYLWINQRAYADMTLLNQPGLSKPLRTTIALHLYKDLLNTVPIFAGSDSKFLGKVCMALDTAVYLPGDVIIHKDDIGREMFIVRKGFVEVLTGDRALPVLHTERSPSTLSSSMRLSALGPGRIILHDGDFFGETALVAEVRRTNTVVAVTICDLNVLSKQAFNEILAEYPDFGAKMKQSVVSRQLANMNIRSATTKRKVETQLNTLVEKSLNRRRMSNTWRGVYKAKKMADKLKSIQEKATKADDKKADDTTSFKKRKTLIAQFLEKVPSKGNLLDLLPRGSNRSIGRSIGGILTARSTRRESKNKAMPVDEQNDEEQPQAASDAMPAPPVGGSDGHHNVEGDEGDALPTAPQRKRKMAAGDLVSRRLNAAEIQSSFVPFALLEINTMVMDIKQALDKVQKKMAVAHSHSDDDSDDDSDKGSRRHHSDGHEPELRSSYSKTARAAAAPGLTVEETAALQHLARLQLKSQEGEDESEPPPRRLPDDEENDVAAAPLSPEDAAALQQVEDMQTQQASFHGMGESMPDLTPDEDKSGSAAKRLAKKKKSKKH
ncbi:Aste57867_21940 [Aphanomyces stellatus]|uniref:Aste57867_21940 protein n=1 Tax=Aphanomyces stellatus TaxID=120398 RepID=A0A485LIX5_9STRA|nr:hypothetical protein As57867_021871 [Aphanomyces stellatus]VFT98608.1 Aste57867_21940 [Aphanomyces stellatus]